MPVKPVNLTTMTTPVKEVNLKAMTIDELRALKNDIFMEMERREREEYDKAVEDFRKALYKLYSEFGNECCIVNDYMTWEDLYDKYDWNFE